MTAINGSYPAYDGNCSCYVNNSDGEETPGIEIPGKYERLLVEAIDDPVSHPSHYTQGDIECIDAMVAAFGKEAVTNFCQCNAFKYVWRANHKNGVEDIAKAVWYLTKFKELTEDA